MKTDRELRIHEIIWNKNEIKKHGVVPKARQIIPVDKHSVLAYTFEKKEIFKLSFAGDGAEVVWRIEAKSVGQRPMSLHNPIDGDVGVFVFCEPDKVLLIDPLSKKILRVISNRVKSKWANKNMAFLKSTNQLVTLGKESLQFMTLN